MASTLSGDEKYALITRRLAEILGGDQIKAVLNEGRTPKCYWGACDLLSCLAYLVKSPQRLAIASVPK
jgi:hypothetical protein